MWLFTTLGFFSATVSKQDPSKMQIRTRERADLEGLIEVLALPHRILETREADYRYRIIVEPDVFLAILADLGNRVNYSNFKDAVHDSPEQEHKVGALTRIWGIMRDFQLQEGLPPVQGLDLWDMTPEAIEHRNAAEGPLEAMPEPLDVLSNPKSRRERDDLAPLKTIVAAQPKKRRAKK